MKVFLIIASLLVMCSCTSYEKCIDKYGKETKIERIPIKVFVPADSVLAKIPLAHLPTLIPGEVVVIESESPENRAKIKYWKDLYSEALMVLAECDSISKTDTITLEIPVLLPAQEKKPSRIEKLFDSYKKFAGWALPIVFFVLLFAISKKRR